MPCHRVLLTRALVGLNILLWFAGSSLAADPGSPGKLTVTWLAMPIHGLAVVLESPAGHVIVIDAGGRDAKLNDYDAGRDAIAPYLRSRGHQQIKAIAISHPHGDHYGGAAWLLENYPVGEFVDSGYEGRGLSDDYRLVRKLAQAKSTYRRAQAGARLAWDNQLEVEILSPPTNFLELDSDPQKITEHGLLNGNSLVLRIRHGDHTFLFPGDAYGMGQRYMLTQTPSDKLLATVLTAPHHGFNSSPEFVAATRPSIVVASCLADYPGSNIRSPADQAIKMYSPVGATVYATCRHGRVQLVSDGKSYEVNTELTPPANQPKP